LPLCYPHDSAFVITGAKSPPAAARRRLAWRVLASGLALILCGCAVPGPADDRGAAPASAAEPPPVMLAGTGDGPRAACLVGARQAERVHDLPPGLLVAIALSESGLHAHALNIGGRAFFPDSRDAARALLATAPAHAPVMAGCVQVNARVHARGSDWPLDAGQATDWAGAMLQRWYAETGRWPAVLARWHGGSPAGTRRVICRVRAALEVTAPGSSVLAEEHCAGTRAERERRNGAALLSVAEAPQR
jgi:hypothetical protein